MPEHQDRRTFLKRSAVAATAVAAGCRSDDASDGATASASAGGLAFPLPAEPLGALADVCLPNELGPDRKARVLRQFEAWLDGFAPVTEQVHGYGSQEITFGPPDPRARWAAQLEALDLEADASYGVRFHELETTDRRALLEAAVAREGGGLGSQPAALEAEHVVEGLLGFFFGSPEAQDLAYRRRIAAFSCRPLEASGDVPPPLEPGS